jgi:DNA-binding CsgD family transcriptional regulator
MQQGGDHAAPARAAYQRRDWVEAYRGLSAARQWGDLDADDLWALADSAWWLGRTDECLALFEEVYRRHLHGARVPQAARLAIEIGFLGLLRGDLTSGSGWMSRARRLLRDEPECAAHGLLLAVAVDEALATGDHDTALTHARQVHAIGQRCNDPDTVALGLVSEGVVLIRQGRVADGFAIIDEAMLPVLAGEVSPGWTGNLYCKVMEICHELGDLRRAREWTNLTERWCADFPSSVMFTGICRVHRTQLMHTQGQWQRAEQEALRACRELATMNITVVAEAHYQLGEIRRLRDDRSGAHEAYRQAHELGRDPHPGLALLRLAEGDAAAAAGTLQTAVAACADPLIRARLRAAQVDVALATGDADTATAAAADLEGIATTYASPGLTATARQARGTALLAQGRSGQSLPALRQACQDWRELDAPYLVARVRVLLARAYLALGDTDAAALELTAAVPVFQTLGAGADAGAAAALARNPSLPGGLTLREAEVLALVADGRSNREIASRLVISEKTVARHLSNIFTKIGVSSRTEAAAFAFSHGLHRAPPA